MRIANRYKAIKTAVDIFVDRLLVERNRDEDPPSFRYVVIPEFIYDLGRPRSVVATSERVIGKVSLREKDLADLAVQPTLFGQDEEEAEVFKYAKNFRRQLKARLLEHQVVTQLFVKQL
jgi:hypothetical protein